MSTTSKAARRVWVAIALVAVAARADIINGGFETGDFTGWTEGGSSANGQVLQAADLAASGLRPPQGRYFALLSTGPGADGIEGVTTLTSLPYIVGNEPVISFDLDFLTSQPSAATPNDDSFEFNVLGNPVSTPQSGDVSSDITNGSLHLIVPGSYVAAPDGTALTYHTGFDTLIVDLSEYQGQTVQFQFLVSPANGAQENFADSALLLDNISAPNVTPTPEPSETLSTTVLLAAIAGMWTLRNRKQRRRAQPARV